MNATGTAKGERRQGRQKKRKKKEKEERCWEKKFKERTCLEFSKSKRAVENGRKEETGCDVICGAPPIPAVKG